MGRKKNVVESLPSDVMELGSEKEEATEANGSPKNLSAAIKEFLAAKGTDVKAADCKAWLAETYPLWRYNEKNLGSTFSTIKSNLLKANGDDGTAPKRSKAAPSDTMPTMEELLDIAKLAKAEGGVDVLASRASDMLRVCQEAGGSLERLIRALETIKEFAALTS